MRISPLGALLVDLDRLQLRKSHVTGVEKFVLPLKQMEA